MASIFQLSISAKGILNRQKENALYVKVFLEESDSPSKEIGQTEIIFNTVNPAWTETISVKYYFEIMQMIRIVVYNTDSSGKAAAKPAGATGTHHHHRDEIIGEVSFTLPSLIRSSGQAVTLDLKKDGVSKGSQIIITGEEEIETNEARKAIATSFTGRNLALDSMSFFSTPETFLTLSRVNDGSTWTVVWRSVNSSDKSKPDWGRMSISLLKLCNSDVDRPLKLTLWEYKSDGHHEDKGSIETCAADLLHEGKGELVFQLIDQKTKTKVVDVVCHESTKEVKPTFAQYLAGGCEISLYVAIDFTASNDYPQDDDEVVEKDDDDDSDDDDDDDDNSFGGRPKCSLHYINPSGELNPYQNAILAVGTILEEYDSDKKYPVLGYGAILPGEDEANLCFNLHPEEEEVHGVRGILESYSETIQKVDLSGPTYFAPVIQTVTALARSLECSQDNQKYAILLLLTDGCIEDMEETIHEIITASHEPLSIVIVGIGKDKEGFERMKELDSDDKLLANDELICVRDIVQFVEFYKFAGNGNALAAEVLAEIPDQLVQFMESRGIVPN